MERLSKMRDGFDPTAPGEFSTPPILSPTSGFDYVKKAELESKFKVELLDFTDKLTCTY